MKLRTAMGIGVMLLALTSSPFSSIRAQGSQPISPDNAVRVTQLAMLGRGFITGLAWSPDGRTLAVASSVGVWLYDANTPDALPRLLEGHTNGVNSIAFSPDGTTLAVGGGDNTVRLWDVASGEQGAVLHGHIRSVW